MPDWYQFYCKTVLRQFKDDAETAARVVVHAMTTENVKFVMLMFVMLFKEKDLSASSLAAGLQCLVSVVTAHEEKIRRDSTLLVFVADATRKALKRMGAYSSEIDWLLRFTLDAARSTVDDCDLLDHTLLLLLTCKRQRVSLDSLAEECRLVGTRVERDVDVDRVLDNIREFYFVQTKTHKHTVAMRLLRHWVLLDPMRSLEWRMSFSHWIALFGESDSELIALMSALARSHSLTLARFYSWIIAGELVDCDFFMNQLLTDAPDTLQLLLDIAALDSEAFHEDAQTRIEVAQFHILLALRVEMAAEQLPFPVRPLMRALQRIIDAQRAKNATTKHCSQMQ